MKRIDLLKHESDSIVLKWAKLWNSFIYDNVSVPLFGKTVKKFIGIEKETGLKIIFKIEKFFSYFWITYLTIRVIEGEKEIFNISYSSFQKEVIFSNKGEESEISKKLMSQLL